MVGYHGLSLASRQPAPVGRERQQNPDRLAKPARQMRRCRVAGDDKIKLADQAARASAKFFMRGARSITGILRQQFGIARFHVAVEAVKPKSLS